MFKGRKSITQEIVLKQLGMPVKKPRINVSELPNAKFKQQKTFNSWHSN